MPLGAVLRSPVRRRRHRPPAPLSYPPDSGDDDYLPAPMTAILLRCHCCFSTVEAQEPRTGSIFTCDMCRAELEVASTCKGHTRPPHRPGVASALRAAISGEAAPPSVGAVAVASAFVANPWAHSATLQRKRAEPAADAVPFHLTPPDGAPALAFDPGAETREQAEIHDGERELEPTTAARPRHPRRHRRVPLDGARPVAHRPGGPHRTVRSAWLTPRPDVLPGCPVMVRTIIPAHA